MKKTDKKREKAIVETLTEVCESALKDVDGFSWVTHLVNYNAFPQSLTIICVFETQLRLAQARALNKDAYLRDIICHRMDDIGVKIKDSNRSILFDTEEDCVMENRGQWQQRFSVKYGH